MTACMKSASWIALVLATTVVSTNLCAAETQTAPTRIEFDPVETTEVSNIEQTEIEIEVEETAGEVRTGASWEAESNETVEDFSDEDDSETQKDQRQLDIF